MTAETEGRRAAPPEERHRVVLGMPPWLPTDRVPPWALPAAGMLFILLFIGFVAFAYFQGWLSEETWQDFGYIGIFVTNFFPHATLFFPLPGLTVTGQVLIVAGSETLNPVLVAVVATLAMTLADCTSYAFGYFGRTAAEGKRPPDNVFGRMASRIARWVDWWMDRAGFITLLVLSGLPNPVYEFAGVGAGAVRYNFVLFVIAVGVGNLIRIVALILIGQAVIDLFEF